MPTTNNTLHTIEALLRVVEERDAEVVFLKLMVDKLALQLLRARPERVNDLAPPFVMNLLRKAVMISG